MWAMNHDRRFRLASFPVLIAALGFLCLPAASAGEPRLKLGIGTGLPYGSPFPGGGLEVELGEHLGLLGGVGFVGAEKPWAYGARVYLQPSAAKWRFHFSALHWIEGNGAYFGVDRRLGSSASGFVATGAIGFGDVNLEGNVHIMIGLGYRF
jgi:hypothetical protein